MMLLIFHAPTMISNTFLAPRATMNGVQRAGNKPLLAWSYVVQCVLLRQLLPRTPTLVALIWLRATWRSGERSENKLTIIMKPDATTLAFGKTLNATYKHWRNSYPREKCDLGFLGRPCHCFSVGSLSLSMSCPIKCNHQCFENLLHSCSLEMQLPCISFI